MRVLIVLMASLLVWGSCKKKHPCSSDPKCEEFGRPYTAEIVLNILNKDSSNYLTAKEAILLNNPSTFTFIDTNKVFFSYEITSEGGIYQGNTIKYFFLKLKENDTDTVSFNFNYNIHDVYDVMYNNQLVCTQCTYSMNTLSRITYKIIKK